MTPFDVATALTSGVLVFMAALTVWTLAVEWRRRKRQRRAYLAERLTGRQQVRAAYRAEAARQLTGAPVSRRVRRRAVGELLRQGKPQR